MMTTEVPAGKNEAYHQERIFTSSMKKSVPHPFVFILFSKEIKSNWQ